MNMNKFFLNQELSLLAKLKGFDEPCLAIYSNEGFRLVSEPLKNSDIDYWKHTYPLYQQIIDWFREKHLIEISASSYYYPKHYRIVYQIGYSHKSNKEYPEDMYGEGLGKKTKAEKVIVFSERYFNSYYEALEKSIEEAFKLI